MVDAVGTIIFVSRNKSFKLFDLLQWAYYMFEFEKQRLKRKGLVNKFLEFFYKILTHFY